MDTQTRSIHTFQEGDLFDNRYRLVKRAGSGGFADVWKAEDTQRDNKVVALKIYSRLNEEDYREMSDEYDRMEDIQHQNLLTGKHFAKMGNIPYLEMRYCDGGNLAHKAGKMQPEEIRKMLKDICSGLDYLHREGIVHQDIKPENILYDTKHNRYMLSDFGISSKSRTRLSKSVNMASDMVSMTMAYAPPEKFSSNPNDRLPDTKGDIFSLGMTVYELATGILPFDQPVNTGDRMLEKAGNVSIYFDNIADPLLRSLVQLCLSYRKEKRPSAAELLNLLENPTAIDSLMKDSEARDNGGKGTVRVRVGGNEPVNPESPKPPKPTPTPNRNWLYIAAAAAIVILAVVVIANRGGEGNDTTDTVTLETRYGQWTGDIVDNQPDGEGVFEYYKNDSDGRARYEGRMTKGLREDSDALLVYTNGNTYQGSFVNDRFGKGKLTLKADGLIFDGEFKNDTPYNGTWRWDDGTVYSKVVNGVEK